MCKHWGLHISMNIDCLGAVLGSFWVVWKGLLWCLKAKLILWQFLRYWQFNKQYHGGYLLICLISWPLLIASRYDWYLLKGLFKGFWDPSRLCESLKNWWRYGWMKFVTSIKLWKLRAQLRWLFRKNSIEFVKLNHYCTVYYYSLIYEPCLHKHTHFFISTAILWITLLLSRSPFPIRLSINIC